MTPTLVQLYLYLYALGIRVLYKFSQNLLAVQLLFLIQLDDDATVAGNRLTSKGQQFLMKVATYIPPCKQQIYRIT